LYTSTSRETQELSTAGLSQGFLTVNWLSKRAYNSRHPLETASNSVNCRTFTRLFNGKLTVKTGLKQSWSDLKLLRISSTAGLSQGFLTVT
jgi:hypothetical protein